MLKAATARNEPFYETRNKGCAVDSSSDKMGDTFRQAKTVFGMVPKSPMLKVVPIICALVSGGRKDPVE
jgi:hypothetical protein